MLNHIFMMATSATGVIETTEIMKGAGRVGQPPWEQTSLSEWSRDGDSHLRIDRDSIQYKIEKKVQRAKGHSKDCTIAPLCLHLDDTRAHAERFTKMGIHPFILQYTHDFLVMIHADACLDHIAQIPAECRGRNSRSRRYEGAKTEMGWEGIGAPLRGRRKRKSSRDIDVEGIVSTIRCERCHGVRTIPGMDLAQWANSCLAHVSPWRNLLAIPMNAQRKQLVAFRACALSCDRICTTEDRITVMPAVAIALSLLPVSYQIPTRSHWRLLSAKRGSKMAVFSVFFGPIALGGGSHLKTLWGGVPSLAGGWGQLHCGPPPPLGSKPRKEKE